MTGFVVNFDEYIFLSSFSGYSQFSAEFTKIKEFSYLNHSISLIAYRILNFTQFGEESNGDWNILKSGPN